MFNPLTIQGSFYILITTQPITHFRKKTKFACTKCIVSNKRYFEEQYQPKTEPTTTLEFQK